MDEPEAQHRSLNIVSSQNAQLYLHYLKHNNYIDLLSTSLKEKLTDEEHTQLDLSLKQTNLWASLPIPISNPFLWKVQPDPCFMLIKEKADYKKKLNAYRKLYQKDKKNLTWASIKKQKNELVNLPQYLIDLINNDDRNPYFDGNYDWFYTQGNLAVVEVHNSPLLIYSQSHKIMSMNLNNFTQNSLNSSLDGPIYNISGFNVNNQSYITVRNKQCVELVQLNLKSSRSIDVSARVVYNTNSLTQQETTPPYIDSLLFNESNLITANVVYGVDIHNIETKKVCYQRKFEFNSKAEGDLCQMLTISNCLLFMARDYISLLDFRVASAEKEKKKAFKKGFFMCNELCAMCLSSLDDNFVYVASRHSVYKVDLREMGVVKTWTHMLDNSPILIKSMCGERDGEEYVFVASFCETVCVHVSGYNHLPFKLSCINDTYDKLKLGHEFVIREDVDERFKLSTTGLASHNKCLYTSNSIGDVFQQWVGDQESYDYKAEDSILKLKAYIAEVPFAPIQLNVTHFKELSTLRNTLLKGDVDARALKAYAQPNRKLDKYLRPAEKFGQYDMAMIWNNRVGRSLAENENEEQKKRIDTWLTQSVAQHRESPEEDMNFESNHFSS